MRRIREEYDTTTRVCFPRFEFELYPHQPLHDRRLVTRAKERKWLSQTSLNQMLNVVSIAHKEPVRNVKNNWWGARHTASSMLTYSDLFKPPTDKNPQVYRACIIDHWYVWDSQAMSGRATELVLEKLQTYKRRPFAEVMAILIRDDHRPEAQEVIIDQDGEWVEPSFSERDELTSFYFDVFAKLATKEGVNSLQG